MSKHTPGPWQVEGAGEKGGRPGIDSQTCSFSVVVIGYCDDDAGIYGRTEDEQQANARLIAAAPELLSTLKLAEEAILDAERIAGFGQPMVLSHIRYAIAKAEVTDGPSQN